MKFVCKSWCVRVWLVALAAPALHAQTTIDLKSQTRNVDFSSAVSTKPSKTGAQLPALCAVGETFFNTAAPAGRNLYFCTTPNVWSQMSGSGGGGPAGALSLNGVGSLAQTTNGGFPAGALPAIDSTGTAVDSGCTATAGSANCPNGFTSGTGASQITMREGPAPPPPGAGQQTLYLDSTDHRPNMIDASSTVHSLATTAGALTSGAVVTYDAAGNGVASACSIASGVLTCGLAPDTTFTLPAWYDFPAAVCQAGTAYLGFNTPDSPSPTCVTGTNTIFGVATFTTGQRGQLRLLLPDDWIAGPGNDLEFHFRSPSAGGAGSIVWSSQTPCAAQADSLDPAFNTVQTTTVAAQPNNLANKARLGSFTTTGCSAGNFLFINFSLGNGTTAPGPHDLLSVRVKLKRAVTTL